MTPLRIFGLPAREVLPRTFVATAVDALVLSAEQRDSGLWRVSIQTQRAALAVGYGETLELAERDAERRLKRREQECRDARAALRGMREVA